MVSAIHYPNKAPTNTANVDRVGRRIWQPAHGAVTDEPLQYVCAHQVPDDLYITAVLASIAYAPARYCQTTSVWVAALMAAPNGLRSGKRESLA